MVTVAVGPVGVVSVIVVEAHISITNNIEIGYIHEVHQAPKGCSDNGISSDTERGMGADGDISLIVKHDGKLVKETVKSSNNVNVEVPVNNAVGSNGVDGHSKIVIGSAEGEINQSKETIGSLVGHHSSKDITDLLIVVKLVVHIKPTSKAAGNADAILKIDIFLAEKKAQENLNKHVIDGGHGVGHNDAVDHNTGDVALPKSTGIALNTECHDIHKHIPNDIVLNGSISFLKDGAKAHAVVDKVGINKVDTILLVATVANGQNSIAIPLDSKIADGAVVGKHTTAEHLVISNGEVETGSLGNENVAKSIPLNNLNQLGQGGDNFQGEIFEDKATAPIHQSNGIKADVIDNMKKSKDVEPKSQCQLDNKRVQTVNSKAIVRGDEVYVLAAKLDDNGNPLAVGSDDGKHNAKEIKVFVGHDSLVDLPATISIVNIKNDQERDGIFVIVSSDFINGQPNEIPKNDVGLNSLLIGGTGIASSHAVGTVAPASVGVISATVSCCCNVRLLGPYKNSKQLREICELCRCKLVVVHGNCNIQPKNQKPNNNRIYTRRVGLF